MNYRQKIRVAHQLRHPFGAENETRTRDPDLGKVVLYQLSYFRIEFPCLVKRDCKDTAIFVTCKLFLIFLQIYCAVNLFLSLFKLLLVLWIAF